ncbi:hypothetical protein NECAME_07095, partial [Necator americanus]
APELLYVMPEHSTAVDMWAVGCIFAEMILRRELFPGRSVSGQIKIILTMLGAPSQKILDEIRCERTRRLIENFGDHAQRPWAEIMYCREREVSEEVIDLISKLVVVDVDDRIDVHGALNHTYITQSISPDELRAQKTCPFKVKMDMAAVETLTHQELTQALNRDVRSADCSIYSVHSGVNHTEPIRFLILVNIECTQYNFKGLYLRFIADGALNYRMEICEKNLTDSLTPRTLFLNVAGKMMDILKGIGYRSRCIACPSFFVELYICHTLNTCKEIRI